MEQVKNYPLVSVIIPVYKVEAFIRECVDSVINQSYKNLEIILVDDGSTDRCPEICDDYALKDSRIKVIHKENGGLSDARNAGMKIATANYWCFVDSDDVCYEKMIDILMKPMIEDETLTMSACTYTKFSGNWNNIFADKNTYFTEQIEPLSYMEKEDLWIVAWAKIYKKDLFNDIKYPKGRFHEDEFTTYKLLFNSQTIAYTNAPFYFYRQREGSIMSKNSFKRIIDTYDALKERIVFFSERNERKLYIITLIDFARHFKECVQYADINKDFFLKWEKELKNYSTEMFSIKQKIKYISFVWFPGICTLIRNCKQIFIN